MQPRGGLGRHMFTCRGVARGSGGWWGCCHTAPTIMGTHGGGSLVTGEVMKGSERHTYEFVALLFIAVNASLGSLSGLLPYPVLSLCAIWLITKKRG
jgi:hypothetical protein